MFGIVDELKRPTMRKNAQKGIYGMKG